jgi:YidC/Oxa1 family membrane protein insertase
MNKETESPFGNPRFLAALAITFLSLWGWQYYMNQKYPAQKTQAAPQSAPTTLATEVAANTVNTNTEVVLAKATNREATQLEYSDEFVSFSVSSEGLGFGQFVIKNYKDRAGEFVKFQSTIPLFAVFYKNEPIHFNITQKSEIEFFGEGVVEGKKITRTIAYNPNTRAIQSEINFEAGIDSLEIKLQQKKETPTSSNFLMPSFEHQDFIFINDGKTHSESISTLKAGTGILKTAAGVEMAGITTQYFAAAFLNKSDFLPAITKKVEGELATLTIDYDLKNVTVSKINQTLYIGAKKTETLVSIDGKFEELLNYGIFGFISKPLLKLLKLMHDLLGNWGLAIIGMTIIVRLVLLPFNVISFRSAQAMQRIKPQMDAVREKYKNDPMRLNKETMALMKEQKANPISGCLPMLLQIPIFFALWRAISSSVELYQQPFFGWITDLSSHDSYFVLPILMGITMFLQQKLTPTTMDPMQAKILAFMPIIFSLFMITLPSGLTLYNFISALFGVLQQYFLLKQTKTTALTPA